MNSSGGPDGTRLDGYPARLVFHADPGRPHFDLFVREPSGERLATYELYVREGDADLAVPETEFILLSGSPGPDFPLRAIRKADHRMHYWEYAGPVTGRGYIEERGRGWLVCPAWNQELALCWGNHSQINFQPLR